MSFELSPFSIQMSSNIWNKFVNNFHYSFMPSQALPSRKRYEEAWDNCVKEWGITYILHANGNTLLHFETQEQMNWFLLRWN